MKKILPFLLLGTILIACNKNSPSSHPIFSPTFTPIMSFPSSNKYYTLSEPLQTRSTFCMISIRLPMKISINQLVLLSKNVNEVEAEKCPRIYIFSYLPDDIPYDDPPWATSYIDSYSGSRFYGPILEDKATYSSYTSQADKTLLGIWLDTRALTRTITITTQDDTYEMISTYEDGAVETKDLFVDVVDDENRLFETLNGEYMVVKSNGNLAFYNHEGLILEIEK